MSDVQHEMQWNGPATNAHITALVNTYNDFGYLCVASRLRLAIGTIIPTPFLENDPVLPACKIVAECSREDYDRWQIACGWPPELPVPEDRWFLYKAITD